MAKKPVNFWINNTVGEGFPLTGVQDDNAVSFLRLQDKEQKSGLITVNYDSYSNDEEITPDDFFIMCAPFQYSVKDDLETKGLSAIEFVLDCGGAE